MQDSGQQIGKEKKRPKKTKNKTRGGGEEATFLHGGFTYLHASPKSIFHRGLGGDAALFV